MTFEITLERAWRAMPPDKREFLLRELIAKELSHGATYVREEDILDIATTPSFNNLPGAVQGLFVLAWDENGFSLEAAQAVARRTIAMAFDSPEHDD